MSVSAKFGNMWRTHKWMRWCSIAMQIYGDRIRPGSPAQDGRGTHIRSASREKSESTSMQRTREGGWGRCGWPRASRQVATIYVKPKTDTMESHWLSRCESRIRPPTSVNVQHAFWCLNHDSGLLEAEVCDLGSRSCTIEAQYSPRTISVANLGVVNIFHLCHYWPAEVNINNEDPNGSIPSIESRNNLLVRVVDSWNNLENANGREYGSYLLMRHEYHSILLFGRERTSHVLRRLAAGHCLFVNVRWRFYDECLYTPSILPIRLRIICINFRNAS